jgi:hypothetical protein
MNETIKIQKTIYSINGINNIIDTNFTQLINPTVSSSIAPTQTIDGFFNEYNTLFYDIPLSGSDESHLSLATRSLNYLGLSLTDLQDELNSLRQENVSLKNQILQISNIKIGSLAQ